MKELQAINHNKSMDIEKLQKDILKIKDSQIQKDSSQKHLTENLQNTVQKLSDLYNQSQITNKNLCDEIQNIEQKLQNINYDDVEERSDIISQIKSNLMISRKSIQDQRNFYQQNSSSPQRIFKQDTYFSKRYADEKNVEIIEENADDDDQQSDQINTSIVSLQEKINLQQKNDNKRKSFLGIIGKSNSNVNEKQIHFKPNLQKQQTQVRRLIAQIDQQSDDITVDDDISQFVKTDVDLNEKQEEAQIQHNAPFIDRNDQSVVIALERLAKLQQFKRLNQDQFDVLIFGDKFKAYSQIKLIDLASIFSKKLNLSHFQAVKFARFLMEEKDENQTDNVTTFDSHKKIDLQIIIVKLMSFSLYPIIYNDNDEEKTKENFDKAFINNQIKFIRLLNQIGSDQNGMIKFQLFIKAINETLGYLQQRLTLQDIECAYIFLCREGLPFSQFKDRFSDSQIQICLQQGFQAKNTYQIFNQLNLENYSKDNSSDKSNEITLPLKNLAYQFQNEKSDELQQQRTSTEEKNDDTPFTPFLGGFIQREKAQNFVNRSNTQENNIIKIEQMSLKQSQKSYSDQSFIEETNKQNKQQQHQNNQFKRDSNKEITFSNKMTDILKHKSIKLQNFEDQSMIKSFKQEQQVIISQKQSNVRDMDYDYSDSRSDANFEMEKSMDKNAIMKLQNDLKKTIKDESFPSYSQNDLQILKFSHQGSSNEYDYQQNQKNQCKKNSVQNSISSNKQSIPQSQNTLEIIGKLNIEKQNSQKISQQEIVNLENTLPKQCIDLIITRQNTEIIQNQMKINYESLQDKIFRQKTEIFPNLQNNDYHN